MFLQKPEIFYKTCLVDFWKYKTMVLANSILNYDKIKPSLMEEVENVNDKECLMTLKLELHFTYYQVVETLFSMIFALYKRRIDNRRLWIYLTQLSKPPISKKLYEAIEKIAEGDTSMFDQKTVAGPNCEMPFVQYLFFFGGSFNAEKETMERNLANIKKTLVVLAGDFVDRDEYNAYKHSFRLFPTEEQKMELIDPSKEKAVATFSMPNSITYLRLEKDDGISQVSKPLDWERDCRMTLLCQALIYNIIVTRRRFYFKEEKVSVNFFPDLDLEETSKMNSNVTEFAMSISPIHDEQKN